MFAYVYFSPIFIEKCVLAKLTPKFVPFFERSCGKMTVDEIFAKKRERGTSVHATGIQSCANIDADNNIAMPVVSQLAANRKRNLAVLPMLTGSAPLGYASRASPTWNNAEVYLADFAYAVRASSSFSFPFTCCVPPSESLRVVDFVRTSGYRVHEEIDIEGGR